MTILFAITKRFLLDLVRQRSNLIWMVLMPLVFTFIFGVLPGMSTSNLSVAVVDNDHSAISHAFIQTLNKSPDAAVKLIPANQTTDTLRNMQASLIITLPKGMQEDVIAGNPVAIGWLKSPSAATASSSDGFSVQDLQAQVERWTELGSVRVEKAKQHGVQDVPTLVHDYVDGLNQGAHVKSLIHVHTDTVVAGQVRSHSLSSEMNTLVGFAAMFIIFVVFSSTGDIFREKLSGTWNRLKVSPAGRFQVIGGYGLAYFIIGWIQFLLMRYLGAWLFHADIPVGGWTILTMSLYILGVSGIALCIAGVSKSGEQHRMIGVFLAIATTEMSGAYWPLDIEPVWMQHLAWFVPQTWALDAFKLAALGVGSIAALAVPLVVLGAFAVVFFTAGMLQLRYS